MLSPEWALPENDGDVHTTRAQLKKRVRWTNHDSERDLLPIDLTETETLDTTLESSQIPPRKHRRILVGDDGSDHEQPAYPSRQK